MEDLSDARYRAPHPAGAASVGRGRRRGGGFAVVAAVMTEVARGRLVVAVEDDAEDLVRLHDAECLGDEPAGRPMSCHHEQEAVHPMGDDPAVLNGTERWRVHDDVVVVVASFFEELTDARRLEHLVRTRRNMSGPNYREIERRPRPGHAVQVETRVEDELDQPRAIEAAEREQCAHGRTAKISVHDENPRVVRLSQRAGQIDRSDALAVPHAGARNGYDAEVSRSLELLDGMTERAILLSFEGSRGDQADQMIVHSIGGVGGEPCRICLLDLGRFGLRGGGLNRRYPLGGALRLPCPISVRLLERLEELAHCPRKPLAACASPDRVAGERSMACRS